MSREYGQCAGILQGDIVSVGYVLFQLFKIKLFYDLDLIVNSKQNSEILNPVLEVIIQGRSKNVSRAEEYLDNLPEIGRWYNLQGSPASN